MTKEEIYKLSQEIENISNYFEKNPWTGNQKLLKENFDIDSINTPKHNLNTIEILEEILRETRIIFLYSVFQKVCIEEGKVYNFEIPFQAGMRYDGVMKSEGSFYLLDEDGDFKEIFTSEKFANFINELYWESYE